MLRSFFFFLLALLPCFVFAQSQCDTSTTFLHHSYCSNEGYYTLEGTTYDAPGFYTHRQLTNIDGCDSTVYLNLSVYTLDTSVTVSSDTLTANHPNADYYEWWDCNTGFVDTGRVFIPSVSGNYAVYICDNNGCCDTSACYQVTPTGLLQVSNPQFSTSLYPNPNNGTAYLLFDDNESQFTIRILDVLGNELQVFNGVSDAHRPVPLQLPFNSPAGVYWLHISQGQQFKVLKWLKQ